MIYNHVFFLLLKACFFLGDIFEDVEGENSLSNTASTVTSTDSESVDFDDNVDNVEIGIMYNNIQHAFLLFTSY
jgi:hypothetical protein